MMGLVIGSVSLMLVAGISTECYCVWRDYHYTVVPADVEQWALVEKREIETRFCEIGGECQIYHHPNEPVTWRQWEKQGETFHVDDYRLMLGESTKILVNRYHFIEFKDKNGKQYRMHLKHRWNPFNDYDNFVETSRALGVFYAVMLSCLNPIIHAVHYLLVPIWFVSPSSVGGAIFMLCFLRDLAIGIVFLFHAILLFIWTLLSVSARIQ